MSREVEELSRDTKDLLDQAIEKSDHLAGDTSIDRAVEHLCRSYLLRGGESEELAGRREEIEERQAELRENILENL